MKQLLSIIALLLVLIACSTTVQETAVSKPVVQPSTQQAPPVPALESQVKAPQEIITPDDKTVPSNVTLQVQTAPAERTCKSQCDSDCEADAQLACKQRERSACKANCGDVIDPSACTQACTYLNQPQSCKSMLEQFCKSRCVQICV